MVALLRGVNNIGATKRIAMADLRVLVERLGGRDVRTLLNSGNVVFSAPGAWRGEEAARLERALAATRGIACRVTVLSRAEVAAVGLARVDKPKPMKAAALLKTYAYAIPKPYVTYFKKGFKTPIPLAVTGNAFSIEVPLSDQGRPGIYGVSVWAKVPATNDLVMISLRTIEVD